MKKVKLGPSTVLYPMPALLIGADGKPDPAKVDPLIFTVPDRMYHRLGEAVGKPSRRGRS